MPLDLQISLDNLLVRTLTSTPLDQYSPFFLLILKTIKSRPISITNEIAFFIWESSYESWFPKITWLIACPLYYFNVIWPILLKLSINVKDHTVSTKIVSHMKHFSNAGVMALYLQKLLDKFLVHSLTFTPFDQSFPNFHKFWRT